MVITYFEIGRMIVKEQQNGKERAGYGKALLKDLSIELAKEFGKGFSVHNLENMRSFFLTYRKSETLSMISKKGLTLPDQLKDGKSSTVLSISEKQQTLSTISEISAALSAIRANASILILKNILIYIFYKFKVR